MLIKRLLTILSVGITFNAGAQMHMTNFCEAMDTVMKESPTSFRNITGRMMQSTIEGTMWASTIKIPGTIGYRIVSGFGTFYEGAVAQSTKKDDLTAPYEEYKKKITGCLESKGYKLTTQENHTAGLSDYPKLVWMIPPPPNAKAEDLPPHVTMEATYSAAIGKYTVVMFIFQH